MQKSGIKIYFILKGSTLSYLLFGTSGLKIMVFPLHKEFVLFVCLFVIVFLIITNKKEEIFYKIKTRGFVFTTYQKGKETQIFAQLECTKREKE